MKWIQDRWSELTGLGSAGWLAVAAWAALVLGVVVLVYVNGQVKKNRALRNEPSRPQVSMFMEPHSSDWHVIELVIRNFGVTAAYDVQLDFTNHPTVAAYEASGFDGQPDITELDLPSELNVLAPGQEWRTVWDSAISREEFGGNIRSRFDGKLTYYDQPRPERERDKNTSRRWNKRRAYETKVVLDWATLQPVQRLELLTTHDLAKREKLKLELLRSVLTYFHYASNEARPDVFRAEIDRMNRAVKEVQDRWQTGQSERRERSRQAEQTDQTEQTTRIELPWGDESDPGGPPRLGPSGKHRDPY